MISANIDDQTPEMLAPVMPLLLEQGAYDVFFSGIQMKKNRPGIELNVLVDPGDQEAMIYTILKHTSTMGVRLQTWQRRIMRRHFETLTTSLGPVRIKVARYQDITKKTPEYEDCQKIAVAKHLTLQQVYQAVYQNL
nr:nickel insertion protein [Agrilactobacillus composti]